MDRKIINNKDELTNDCKNIDNINKSENETD